MAVRFSLAVRLRAAMSLQPSKRRRQAAEVADQTARGAPALISPGRGAASAAGVGLGAEAGLNAQQTCGSGMLTVGSICSGIGVCHRAAAAVNACSAGVILRDAFACEVAPSARRVLVADFPDMPLFGDVCKDGVRLPLCDVLVAGFPCQPFSAANRRRKGSSDRRCGVVSHIIRYIERAVPALVVLENVVGLFSFGRDVFLELVRHLQAADYSIAATVLRSEVRGGAPQRRHRLFIVALRSSTNALGWPGRIPMQSLPSILAKACWSAGSAAVCARGRQQDRRSRALLGSVQRLRKESAHMVVNCHS